MLGFLVMMTFREVVVEVVVVVLMSSLLPLASCEAWIRLVVDFKVPAMLPVRPPFAPPQPVRRLTDVAVNPETPGPLKVDI